MKHWISSTLEAISKPIRDSCNWDHFHWLSIIPWAFSVLAVEEHWGLVFFFPQGLKWSGSHHWSMWHHGSWTETTVEDKALWHKAGRMDQLLHVTLILQKILWKYILSSRNILQHLWITFWFFFVLVFLH